MLSELRRWWAENDVSEAIWTWAWIAIIGYASTFTSIINGVGLFILGMVIYQIQSMLANITHSTIVRRKLRNLYTKINGLRLIVFMSVG